jgi:dihydrofolate reductase
MRTSLFVAADENDVIGRDGTLPWHFSEDLKRFRRLTEGHVMVSGRLNNDSMIRRLGHPLPGRITVVVSRQLDLPPYPDVVYKPDVASALAAARTIEAFAGGDEVFVIGGAQIYRDTLDEVSRVYLTRVHGSYDGDTVMPAGWLAPFVLHDESPQGEFSYLIYERG